MNMSTADLIKVGLVFINGFAGLIAAYPGPELGALERLVCAALVAGCGAALLALNPPGKAPALTADEVAHVKAAVKAVKKADKAAANG